MKTKMQHISEQDDRISNLPIDVIHRIMEFIPVLDAAQTCVLSHKWKYIWANHPSLVLDDKFWNDVKNKRPNGSVIDFAKIVSRIILHHIGSINKFVIDISNMTSEEHHDVHLWTQFLCRRGLTYLSVESSNSNLYTVSSCVFASSEMTYLKFSHCILKINFGALSNLKTLIFEHVTLPSCVLTLSHVTILWIKLCLGTRGLNISTPRLTSLYLINNDDFLLTPYLTCTDIIHARFFSRENINRLDDCESINIMKLFQCWPKISQFVVDRQCHKYLAASVAAPNEVPFPLDLRILKACDINFEMDEITSLLWILKNSCFLQRLQLWGGRCLPTANQCKVVNYLEKFSIMNQGMKQLQQVKIAGFAGSKVEIMFAKILLHHSPLLEQMEIEVKKYLDPNERLRISKELMRLPRTSPKAILIYW